MDEWNKSRRAIAERYRAGLANRFHVPTIPVECEHVFHIYCLRVAERGEVVNWLNQHGVASGLHYPVPLHKQPGLVEARSRPPESCPVAEVLAHTCLSLPIFPEMTDHQVDMVIEALQEMPRFETKELS